eukprot:CAMPEP_0179124236 /NCGR_PEP_ID=MMETSP0796-20121207/58702_1 /TAXON_ID=73915 /ORGANISM="Pyrodinium bahamense, Strain pbaha01" /LENGTH=124 /DNA_ID=CAMNT_0020822893 /DNA_START=78 /DNA_END=452 /DNA_ORIENTATION=+
MAAAGAEQMAALPVAERVNFQIFQRMAQGAAVRVGGRLSGAAADAQQPRVLTTTDGGSLMLTSGAELPPMEGFVEVVGTKAGEAALAAVGVVPLPGGAVDAELWDEAVKMAHMPQLRSLFAPSI